MAVSVTNNREIQKLSSYVVSSFCYDKHAMLVSYRYVDFGFVFALNMATLI